MKNEYKVTWALYRVWLSENLLERTKLCFTVFWLALGSCIVGFSAVYRSPLLLILAVFCFYRAFIRDYLFARKQYRSMASRYGEENWLRTISFNDAIVLTEGNVTLHFHYADVTGVKEKENKVWLIFKDKSVMRLYKDKFVNSSWEECRDLLASKVLTPLSIIPH